jgi:hypothetical protein
MVGTLKELIEYTCLQYRGQLGLYRITVGTNRYGDQVIRDLFHSPNFPKSSKGRDCRVDQKSHVGGRGEEFVQHLQPLRHYL